MNPSFRDVSLLLGASGTMPAIQWKSKDSSRPFSVVHQRLAERSMRHTRVTELMSSRVRSVSAEATVHEAAQIMQDNEYACIVIVEGREPVGIITERDMIRILAEILAMPRARQYYVRDFMSAPPVCLNDSASLYDALSLAQSSGLGQIPVVDKANQVVGILSRERVARAHLAAVEHERDAIEQQIRNRSRELSEANRELKALALQDSLLKIGNRRAMELDVHAAHGNAVRYRQSYAVALVDVDYFKRYNDCYGHGAGDRALITVADCIKDSIRRGDRVYRYGGEEFLVLMREASLAEAVEAVHRLTGNLFQLNVEHSESPHKRLTISAGVSAFAGDGDVRGAGWEAVVEAADALLYQAKALGRNQVCGFSEQGRASQASLPQ